MKLRHVAFFLIGLMSLALIVVSFTPLRVSGLVVNILISGYCFLELLNIPDGIVLSMIVGVFIFAFTTLIINYTHLRYYSIVYGIPGIVLPSIILLSDLMECYLRG